MDINQDTIDIRKLWWVLIVIYAIYKWIRKAIEGMKIQSTGNPDGIPTEPRWPSPEPAPTRTPELPIEYEYDRLSQQKKTTERELQEKEKQIEGKREEVVTETIPAVKAMTEKKKLTLFRNKKDVLQAIVMKEILAPPKSVQ
jgi:hypothetical protein